MYALFGVPALWILAYLLRARIVVNDEGIFLRGLRRTVSASWSQIEDFELRDPTLKQSLLKLPIACIKVGDKWHSISNTYSHYDELLERIAREAKWSRSREWLRNDLREDGEWPKTFVYKDASVWRIFGPFLLQSALLCSLLLFEPKNNSTNPGPLIVTWGSLCLVPFAEYFSRRKLRHYIAQKVTATPAGLFQNETFLTWEEIEAYYYEVIPGAFNIRLCVVETKHERLEWVSGISDAKTLNRLVQDRARNATTPNWAYRYGADSDVIGGAASLWKDGDIGVGPKIYHYRTRTLRALLYGGLVMSLVMLVPLTIGPIYPDRQAAIDSSPLLSATLAVFLSGLTLFGLCRYLFASLQCEERGLLQIGLRSERFIPWDEVEKIVFNGSYTVVCGHRAKIRFGLVADLEGLWEEIEKRSGVKRTPAKKTV